MQNVKYDFSSTHIDVPDPLAGRIAKWSNDNIKDSHIFVSQTDPTFGREDEIHVTILYGIHSDSPDEVEKIVAGHGPITVTLGEIDVFTNPEKFDVVVIKVDSKDLIDLNNKLTDTIEFTNKYKEYKPHVTLAYVKKGKGWQYHGRDEWKGQKFSVSDIVFSSTNGTKTKIPVGRQQTEKNVSEAS